MSKKVATITFNPAYDLVGLTGDIKTGEVNRIQTAGLYPAGKGINVGKILRALDIDVTVGGFLGKDNQTSFQKVFTELGITNRFQVVEGRTRINVKLTEQNGLVTDFNFSGFSVSKEEWQHFAETSLKWLSDFNMVCVSGSLPAGVEMDDFINWMQRLREICLCVVFDSSREALAAGLKARPWMVKPNRQELEIWAGRPLPTQKDIITAAHELRAAGISHVVVSLGEEGAILVNSAGAWLAKPPHCEIVSTVGAGDAMVGGLIYGLMMGQPIEHTLRLATAISAMTVSQSDVGNINRQELAQLMAKVELTSLKKPSIQKPIAKNNKKDIA
ncbi:1-phosphofructokinase [Xenorhabdus mauleonii]|uniref:Phosphofructokinase n=1 Tax=Xenorhabdus mauleonii TaxID=351675 RepID=A0A1I3KI77_9GAMM|nr:1-phosphofructokinase [Xenorhabdus mauleonii]PHM45060.1 1-phosphofructokinase [Xenorhabdus mauleonii]SFI72183.1 1-phosphofructokinase [Xenorhabdus mauleonii]